MMLNIYLRCPQTHVVVSLISMILVGIAFAPLLQGDHEFSNYFDDKYNFESYPQFNSLWPLTVEHLKGLMTFRGINVYEPVWLLFKAIAYDFGVSTAHRLRLLSFVVHISNSFLLLPSWMRLWLNNGEGKDKNQMDDVIVALISLLFAVHPLNVQVIGWLSAQGYLLALFFALLSGISFEICFQQNDKDNSYDNLRKKVPYCLISFLCYILACYSKAPAIMLAPFHMLRAYLLLIQTDGDEKARQHKSSTLLNIFLNFIN